MKSIPPLQDMFKMAGMELPAYMKGGQKNEAPWPVPHEAGPERWMADAGEPVETDPHREMPPEVETEHA